MSLFLPNNVSPLPSAASYSNHEDYRESEYLTLPKDMTHRSVSVDSVHLSDESRSNPQSYVRKILTTTPKPKGRYAFSNIHLVGPSAKLQDAQAEHTIQTILDGSSANGIKCTLHRLNHEACVSPKSGVACTGEQAMLEYNTIFQMASSMLLHKADRASLLLYVGWSTSDATLDAYAAFIGMLPFRGVSTALISRVKRSSVQEFTRVCTPSATFVYDGINAARMGKYPISTIYSPHADVSHGPKTCDVQPWNPIGTSTTEQDEEVIRIPFKIGGLALPMLTHNGSYHSAIQAFAELLEARYPKGYTPIVSCGETVDALGYGQDMLSALEGVDGANDGMLFVHKSGETYKRYDNYGTEELFSKIQTSTKRKPAVIIALGGGVNGNCIGLIAALTNVEFIEVPTTPMHYNDAVTSAKKAFSLVDEENDTILSKNILGAFYLPQLAYCINETLLTISVANAYATVGESCKTMNMLGMADSVVGMRDFSNILGATEFASDFTTILSEVSGFEYLIQFILDSDNVQLKERIISIGKKIAALRNLEQESGEVMKHTGKSITRMFPSLPSLAASLDSTTSDSSISSESEEDDDSENGTDSEPADISDMYEDMDSLIEERRALLSKYRSSFHDLSESKKAAILSFLTTINREIVRAKAMFLAYSDPFEKYRALLFEYAHTLGHGVEAFANDLYLMARQRNVPIPVEALRLHGQCVGMAVLWAGDMSRNLGKLEGKGYTLHQSFPYLFNRAAGGFSFAPLRDLCDALGVSKAEFTEKVLQVVRRDNKRGYCNCSDPTKSVDQLVTCRPGKMLGSDDPNAEVRYLVEVDESWQKDVLDQAFDGLFDQVCDVRGDELVFVPNGSQCHTSSTNVASHIRKELLKMYHEDMP